MSDKNKELVRDYLNDNYGLNVTEVIGIKEVSGWTEGLCTTCAYYEEGVEIEYVSSSGTKTTMFMDEEDVLDLLKFLAKKSGILSD